jgi:iron complex transport system substrate-binding protein
MGPGSPPRGGGGMAAPGVAAVAAALAAAVGVAVGLVTGAAGCHRVAPGASPVAPDGGRVAGPDFTDELGRRVVPRAWPTRRLISLAPNVTELLFAIGAGPQVVGVDAYSDEPAAGLASVARVGSDYDPSVETIVHLAPDLVLSSSSANRRETVEALDRLGIPTFVTDTRALGDVDRLLGSLGRLTGHAPEASAERARLASGLADVRRSVAATGPGTGRRVKVLVVVWTDPLYVAGRDTFIDDLVEVAGGINVARDARGFARYPLEQILSSAPEVIIAPSHAPGDRSTEARAFWSRWPTLPAVAHGRVHVVEDSLVVRPGARLVEGARVLAALIHPGAAGGPAAEEPSSRTGPSSPK